MGKYTSDDPRYTIISYIILIFKEINADAQYYMMVEYILYDTNIQYYISTLLV